MCVQGYLAHKKTPPRRTLQWGHAFGPVVVLWAFLASARAPTSSLKQSSLTMRGGVCEHSQAGAACFHACPTPAAHTQVFLAPSLPGIPYRGTSLISDTPLLGPYRRTLPRVLWWSFGGGGISHERGTPVSGEGVKFDSNEALGRS